MVIETWGTTLECLGNRNKFIQCKKKTKETT